MDFKEYKDDDDDDFNVKKGGSQGGDSDEQQSESENEQIEGADMVDQMKSEMRKILEANNRL